MLRRLVERVADPVRKNLFVSVRSTLPGVPLFALVAKLVDLIEFLLPAGALSSTALWHLLHVSAVYPETFDNAIAFSVLTFLGSLIS